MVAVPVGAVSADKTALLAAWRDRLPLGVLARTGPRGPHVPLAVARNTEEHLVRQHLVEQVLLADA